MKQKHEEFQHHSALGFHVVEGAASFFERHDLSIAKQIGGKVHLSRPITFSRDFLVTLVIE
jgi:hypothetical protein